MCTSSSKIGKIPSRRKKSAYAFMPEHVWIDKSVANHPQTIRIMNKLQGVETDIVDDVRLLKHPSSLSAAKKQMILTEHKGRAFKPCQGIGAGHLCCNYRVIDLISGCPMDCSYCILQSYLANNPRTTVYVNIESILSDVASFLDSNPNRNFRIGTGELADSLALDPIIEYAPILIPFFASKKNAILELKTKSTAVDHLLNLRHNNKTVISWSVNSPSIIETDERDTASLDERFAAAKRAVNAGYKVGFHFDPMIITKSVDDEMDGYLSVANTILEHFNERDIAWISLGSLRYPKDLAEKSINRFKDTRIFSGELVPAGNKMRYLRFVRQSAYKPLWDRFSQGISENKLYLCMETAPVWQKIAPAITKNTHIENRLCKMDNFSCNYSL